MTTFTGLKCPQEACFTMVIGADANRLMEHHNQLLHQFKNFDFSQGDERNLHKGSTRTPCQRCLYENCDIVIMGNDSKNLMKFHIDSKHGVSFEKTNLGRMPPEILLRILGYVVPDCRTCFQQKYILELGSVCKKLNEIIKSPELYRELIHKDFLASFHSASNYCNPAVEIVTERLSQSFFEKMIKNHGSQLRKITFGEGKEKMILHSLKTRGDTIQEIYEIGIKHKKISRRLTQISRINPVALSRLVFDVNCSNSPLGDFVSPIYFPLVAFTLSQKRSKEPLHSRIRELKVARANIPFSYDDLAGDATFVAQAICGIQNLQKVTIRYPETIYVPGTAEILTVLITFKDCLERDESLSPYHISYSEERKLENGFRKEVDITWRRRSKLPQLNPDEAFKMFLKGL